MIFCGKMMALVSKSPLGYLPHGRFSKMVDQYGTGVEGSLDLRESDSRKRPLDASSDSGQSYKRSNLGAAKTPIVKVLVPNYAAGSIIGKGGANIAQVQQTTGARIKLSPNNEYYPGTQERIGLIMGEVENIIEMLNFVIEKVRQEPQGLKNPAMSFDRERAKTMKIVVPNSTAGMIIGKAGVTVKSINEQTGAKVQITQKTAENVPGERVVSVTGMLEQVEAACAIIAAKVQEDPDHALNNKITYTDAFVGRSGFSNGQGGGLGLHLGGAGGLSVAGLGGLGLQASGNSAAANQLLAQAALLGGSALGGANALPSSLGFSQTSSSIHSTATLEISVPDELIGAVLGKGGKTITEFMQYSGAKIQVSQKGEYVPGTSNRKVIITGDMQAAQLAHFLITQRIQQVESERQLNHH